MGSQFTSVTATASSVSLSGFNRLLYDLLGPITGALMNGAIICGLAIGGLMTASSMGSKISGAAVGSFNGAASGFGKWAGRKGTQVGTAPLRTGVGRNIAAKLQQSPFGSRLGKPLSWASSYLGGGLEKLSAAGTEGQIKDAETRLGGQSDEQLGHMMTRATAAERQFIIERLHKNGSLNYISDLPKYLKEGEFARYNKSLYLKNLKNETGISMVEAMRSGKPEDEIKEEFIRQMKTATNTGYLAKTFFANREKTAEMMKSGTLMGVNNAADLDKFQEYVMRGLALGGSGSALSKFYTEAARGDQLDQAHDAMQRAGVGSADIADKASKKYYESSGAKNLGLDATGAGVS